MWPHDIRINIYITYHITRISAVPTFRVAGVYSRSVTFFANLRLGILEMYTYAVTISMEHNMQSNHLDSTLTEHLLKLRTRESFALAAAWTPAKAQRVLDAEIAVDINFLRVLEVVFVAISASDGAESAVVLPHSLSRSSSASMDSRGLYIPYSPARQSPCPPSPLLDC